MFNYIKIDFPTIDTASKPTRVMSFILNTTRFQHEIAVAKFRDWNINYDVIRPGTPVKCLIKSPDGNREFVGYISNINANSTPGKKFVEVVMVGASYVLKQAEQNIFTDYVKGYVLASDVVKKIAKKHKFSYCVYPYERRFPQIVQAGYTDFELIGRLAEQAGYSFFIKNTTIYFRPNIHQFNNTKQYAKKFVMRDQNDPSGSTLYSFNLLLGESTNFSDIMKAAYAVNGVSDNADSLKEIVNNKQKTIRVKYQNEFFDRYATNIVANDQATAAFEVKALDDRTRFAYRATLEVDGAPSLLPDMAVYVDGVGKDYSGYWIVLSVTHQVTEESINKFKYTTVLEVGADSLGSLNSSKRVSTDNAGKRILIPGIKNKVISSSYKLLAAPSTASSKNTAEVFGSTKNKKVFSAATLPKKYTQAPIWADSKGDVSSGLWLT
jgi:hypothetical protein